MAPKRASWEHSADLLPAFQALVKAEIATHRLINVPFSWAASAAPSPVHLCRLHLRLPGVEWAQPISLGLSLLVLFLFHFSVIFQKSGGRGFGLG